MFSEYVTAAEYDKMVRIVANILTEQEIDTLIALIQKLDNDLEIIARLK